MKAEGILDFREKARYYIMYIGNEIFDCIDLKRRIARLSKLVPITFSYIVTLPPVSVWVLRG